MQAIGLCRRGERRKTVLCIEAGVRGWELIEYKELYQTACEYLGESRVHKVCITKEEGYLTQVKRALDTIRPTHYAQDPRTGGHDWRTGPWQAFRISLLLASRRVIPIVGMADMGERVWRAQCAMVTAVRGVVVGLLPPRIVLPIFPHRRIIGPSPMPISLKTLDFLNEIYSKRQKKDPPTAFFMGSLYEPRQTILSKIEKGLEARGLRMEVRGRQLGSARFSDFDYWSGLTNAALVVTTSAQTTASGSDWTWIPHLIYRYIETMACGSLLVAPEVPGIQRYFTSGEHFVSYDSPEQAVDVIEFYLTHEADREKIARQGRTRAHDLIRARSYWTAVDIGLGGDSLT